MNLASQFGLDIGGGGGSLFTTDNLLLLLKSNRIIQGALLRPLPELREGNLYNLYLATHYKKALKEKTMSLLPLDLKRESFNRDQEGLLKGISFNISEYQLTVAKRDKKASFIDISVKDENELFAFWMNKMLVEMATELYLELKVGKMKRSIKITQNKIDSIQRVLNSTMRTVAIGMDQSMGLVSNAPRIGTAKTELEAEMLGTLYGELTRNLEMSKYTLEREEPTIQIVDNPTIPLEKFGKGRVKSGIYAGLISFFVVLAFLFLKKRLDELYSVS
jgi:hypothetical protein